MADKNQHQLAISLISSLISSPIILLGSYTLVSLLGFECAQQILPQRLSFTFPNLERYFCFLFKGYLYRYAFVWDSYPLTA